MTAHTRREARMRIGYALGISLLLHGFVATADGWSLPAPGAEGGDGDADAAMIDAVLLAPAAPGLVSGVVARPPARRPRPPAHPAIAPDEGVAVARVPPPAQPAAAPGPESPAAPDSERLAQPADATPAADALRVADDAIAMARADDAAATRAPVATPMAIKVALPPRGEIRYSLRWGERGMIVGEVIHTWERGEGTYRLSAVAQTTGLAALVKKLRDAQESVGTIDEAGLHPLHFVHEQVKRTLTAEFDRARNVVRNGDREDALAEPGQTQDFLSMYYQLAMRVAGATDGEALPAPIDLPIVTGRKLQVYRFEPVARESLDTALGDIRALHVRARNRDDQIDLWLAPDQLELPLRIRLVDSKGEVYEQVVQSVHRSPVP